MQLAFLVNKHVTMAYADLAAGLERQGHTVFWLSPSRRWSRWLVERGWRAEHVLTLPDRAAAWRAMPLDAARRALAPLEAGAGLAIANLILMDRGLRRRPSGLAYGFLAVAADVIRRFVLAHDIRVCFGEATWAWEILTWMVCRSLGRHCMAFTTVRVPSDRFAFFDAARHQVIEHRVTGAHDRVWAAEFLAAYRARPEPPRYAPVPSALRFRRHWLDELRLALVRPALDRDDMTIWPMRERVRHRLRLAVNAATLRLVPPFEPALARAARPSDQRFVLFCLHHQPEASIDVVAALYSDQAHAVERLARVLPASHELWVKEHPAWLGDRSRRWLTRLARLPCVRLIDPHESSLALIRCADLVVSPSGTVAYEAALLGVPAATLAPLYFSRLMATVGDPVTWDMPALLDRLGDGPRDRLHHPDDARVCEFLAWLHAQSFTGCPDRLAAAAMAGRVDDANLAAVLSGLDVILGWVARDTRAAAE